MSEKSSPVDISLLLQDLQQGKKDAVAKLVPLIYSELRRLAARFIRQERPGHTLQATALVHEAYLKLMRQQDAGWQSRTQFFGIAAHLMREILVEHARKRQAAKRGGMLQQIQLDEALVYTQARSTELVALDEALNRLEKLDPQQSRIVELRYFAGLTVEETATLTGVSTRTVKRDWSVARVWLHREISRAEKK